MDIQSTVVRVKKEYKDYLRNEHPEWAESTLNTHVSDGFYLYQNSIALPFWQIFESDETMAAARQELLEYLTDEVMSDRAKERAGGYYRDMVMLRKFLDGRGGVRQVVGYEYECEAVIYTYAKRVYSGELSTEDAVKALCQEVPCFGEGSHRFIVGLLSSMVEGKIYKWKANVETTVYFIEHIGLDYGKEKMLNALKATQENIKYYYEQSGNKSITACRYCQRLAQKHAIDISFGEDIFDGIIPKESTDTVLSPNTSTVRYWIYAAGDGSVNWESDYAGGIMAIGWEEMGNLSNYGSKEEFREKMQEVYGSSSSYSNSVLALWQFANEIKPGDVVFVKKGRKRFLGRGVVESEYLYDPQREYYKNLRKVRWTDKGEWEHPEQGVMKTLTDITPYTDYLKKLQALFDEDKSEDEIMDADEPVSAYDSYTEESFLQDVYMDEQQYHSLVKLLLTKKNVILQGAPGVGKTYAAKRLAFSIMGEQDISRVQMVQFHQSYSYEDFIMGFRPTETGFTLKKGVFYEFCRKAAEDDRPYFFIIDEINRGNLSKIFGELFMLIESDKRGVELQLLYADEQFSIPSNVHIIGMMNTADRSLAMLDYALRRRFAFFEMAPAFESAGFRAYRSKAGNAKFDRLIDTVERLNEAISDDDSLGEGFQIGHSYFCTKTTINDDWMKSVVEFELIPLLKEYWFDEPAKVKEWSRALREAVR